MMIRTKLLTAVAATALLAAPAAFAQTAPTQPAPTPGQTPSSTMTPPATTAAPQTMPAQPASPAAATAAPAAQANNVVDVLKAQGNFSTLLTALEQAQLTETLSSRPAITIFAPTDAAFAALPEADRTRLLDPANAQELRNLLLYHVIVADVTSDQIEGARGPVDTAGGAKIQLDGTGEAIKADGATVIAAEIDAGNGGVFPIDRVLNPTQSMAAMGDEDADDTAAPAASTTAAPAPTATTTTPATTPATTDDAAADETATPVNPSEATTSANPATPTTTTRSTTMGETAPTGQPADTKTTTQAPTVPNATDGQQDDEDSEDDAPPATTPQA